MASVSAPLPRVTIQFCTQCKWMLRAAYVSTTNLKSNSYRTTGYTFLKKYISHHTNSARCRLMSRYLLDALHVTFPISYPRAFTFLSRSIWLILYRSLHKSFCQPSVPPLARWPFSLQQVVRLLSHSIPPIRPQVLGTPYKFSAMSSGIEKQKEGFPVRIHFHRVMIVVNRKS